MEKAPSAEDKLKALILGARTILEKHSFKESARAIFDYCCQMTGAVSGYVALLTEDGQENELLFLEAGGMPCTVPHDLPMPIRGLRAEAYLSHKTVFHNHFMDTEWVKYMPDGHVVLNNVLFAPLNIEGQTVGIIGLANKPADFTPKDAEIASIFGDLAAIALMNSRHIDKLQEQKSSLEDALTQVKTLRGLLPMCSNCKKIRDDQGFWNRVDSYLTKHTHADITHGMCPDCLKSLYSEEAPELFG